MKLGSTLPYRLFVLAFLGFFGMAMQVSEASELKQLEAAKKSLAQALQKYTEQHPDVLSIRRQISRLEKYLAENPPKIPAKATPKPNPRAASVQKKPAAKTSAQQPKPPELPAIGKPGQTGINAKAIAQWDVVPFQTINKPFQIGVVAFHMAGINRVEFSINGGPKSTVTSPKLNPRTKVKEYSLTVDPSRYKDGEVSVSATAHPNIGVPRKLEALRLYANSRGSLIAKSIYVSTKGNNKSGDGSKSKPYRTIARGIITASRGGTVVLMDHGWYSLAGSARRKDRVKQWITIRGAKGLDRDKIILGHKDGLNLVRLGSNLLQFQNLSIDLANVLQIYPESRQVYWFDNVRWFDSIGWTKIVPRGKTLQPIRTSRDSGGYFVTDSKCENSTFCFLDANLVRNVYIEKVSGDVLQNSRLVLNARIHDVDGDVKSHHTDLLQYFGQFENLIVYGVLATGVKNTQNIFLDHHKSSFTNSAFINIAVENLTSDPPFSQLNSSHDHVLFMHLSTPRQSWVFRDDFKGGKQFRARNVIFANNIFRSLRRGKHGNRGVPSGVVVTDSHFTKGPLLGRNGSVGDLKIVPVAGWNIDYEGGAKSKISSSGKRLPAISINNWKYGNVQKPNRGAFPVQPLDDRK